MFSPKDHREAGRNVFIGTVHWFANLLALIVAFLMTPVIYGNTVEWVQRFTTHHYGYGFDDLVAVIWFGLMAGIVFCVARMTTSTLIVMGGLALASRFFV